MHKTTKEEMREIITATRQSASLGLASNKPSEEKTHEMVKLHRFINAVVKNNIENGFINNLVTALLNEMEDGYRVVFPALQNKGRVVQCVALLALAHDPRLKSIRQLIIPSEATHVLVMMGFQSENEWLQCATQVTKMFPEQPSKHEWIIVED